MSYNNNTNSKVNPFDIDQDDEEDPWDDDVNDDDVYGDDNDTDNYDDGYFDGDNNDEQMKLMNGKSRRSKASRYNTSLPADYHRRINNNRSSSDYHEGIRFYHRPQMGKYLFIVVPIVLIIVIYFSNDGSNSRRNNKHSKGDYISLIDEIPNDEYKIVVLGERHSGTIWMRDRIKECFPHAEVTTTLQRPTYFFQDDEQTAIVKEQQQLQNDNGNNEPQQKNIDTIVIHVTLNVYDWLEQMRLSPEYAPDHVGTHKELGHAVPLEWKEFVTKPWTMKRPSNDLPFANMTGPVCQYGFSYNEVVSCTGRQSSSPSSSSSLLKTNNVGIGIGIGIGDPMYEFQRSDGGEQNNDGEEGIPFESIIDLRADKIRNHQNIFNSWPSIKKMIHISYETTGRDFKKEILQEILDFTGWNDGKYKDDNTGITLPCSGDVLPPSLDSSKGMTTEFVKYVSEQVDWEAEKLISHERWTKKDIVAKRIYKEKKTKPTTTTTTTKSTAAAATASSRKGKNDGDVEISINNNKETSDKSSENDKKSTASKDKSEISEKESTNTDAESSSSSRSSEKDDKKNKPATDEYDSKSSTATIATDNSITSNNMKDSVGNTSSDELKKKKSSDTASTIAKKKKNISTTTKSSGSTKDNKKETTGTETTSSSLAKVSSEEKGKKTNDKTKENKGHSIKKIVSSVSSKDPSLAATDSQPTSGSSKRSSSSSSSNSGTNTKKSTKKPSSSKDNEKNYKKKL